MTEEQRKDVISAVYVLLTNANDAVDEDAAALRRMARTLRELLNPCADGHDWRGWAWEEYCANCDVMRYPK